MARRDHQEFLTLLTEAELVVTSPGLTTLLEASVRDTPVVCMPPQNLSQIANAQRFATAVHDRCVVPWPAAVLDLAAVEQAKAGGEDAALAVIHAAVDSAAAAPETVETALQASMGRAITAARHGGRWSGLVDHVGSGGGTEVAEAIAYLLAGNCT